MIRPAKKTDFPAIFPILKQIFDEMALATIAAIPPKQFYELMRLGFLTEDYRYAYRRIWVATSPVDNQVVGILVMYPDSDQDVIDQALSSCYAKVGLPTDTVIFSDKEAWLGEWYIDALAVASAYWGQHFASQLLDYAIKVARSHGFKRLTLNVDLENPRAIRLYKHKGYQAMGQMTIGTRTYEHLGLAL